MAFIKKLKLLERIDALVARKGTGSAEDLADKLGICRSSIFNHLDTLRQFGAEIDYCKFKKSYFYVNDKRPRLPMIPKSDSENYYGGESFFDFFRQSKIFGL